MMGFSRLDDGDPATFWKSNPYLDSHFTRDPDTEHPQWVVVNLGKPVPINTIHIDWAEPYATDFRVEYCDVSPEDDSEEFSATFATGSRWVPFPQGHIVNGTGGRQTISLTKATHKTRFLRLVMTKSSHTTLPGSHGDIRDTLGYAIREIEVGRINSQGTFTDCVTHSPHGKEQSPIYASSTDPWHRAEDKDINTEQPGFDSVFAANVSANRPVLLPVGVVYDTPENAVNLLRYVCTRHFPVTQIELGEEPDGQYIAPEDYAALYLQFAHALHTVDPTVQLGGPSFQTATDGWIYWANNAGDRSWMRRFLNYLRQHNATNTFNFFSFEWYPFDVLTATPETLLRSHPDLLNTALARLAHEGVPTNIPWLISELGWSPFSAESEVDLPGALLDAEVVADFLTQQKGTAYFYGVQPGELEYEQGATPGVSWGGLFAFLADDTGRVTATLPTAWTARLLKDAWFETNAGNREHTLYKATVRRQETNKDDGMVGAYALRQPDGAWAVLFLNRNAHKPCLVTLPQQRDVQIYQYGPDQFRWLPNGSHGHPAYSRPPHTFKTNAKNLTLPPMSISVAIWKTVGKSD